MKRDYDRIAKQLSELEKLYASSPGDEADDGRPRPGEARQFISGTLSALGNIRREELDRDRDFGYSASSLGGMHSNVLAQHLAALSIAGHEDEDYACALLEERGEHDLLAKAYGVVDWLRRCSDAS